MKDQSALTLIKIYGVQQNVYGDFFPYHFIQHYF